MSHCLKRLFGQRVFKQIERYVLVDLAQQLHDGAVAGLYRLVLVREQHVVARPAGNAPGSTLVQAVIGHQAAGNGLDDLAWQHWVGSA